MTSIMKKKSENVNVGELENAIQIQIEKKMKTTNLKSWITSGFL